MLLPDLLARFNSQLSLDHIPDVDVQGIEEDSRHVHPGDLFVARPGTKTDGSHYIAEARTRGAVAVITASAVEGCPLPQVVVKDIAAVASRLANVYHDEPSQCLKVIGITGTNGKTTTAYLVRHLLNTASLKCGMIGTVEIDDGARRQEAVQTTPGPMDVASLLANMAANGCAACAMETSSHSLDQHRVDGLRFMAAAFTNLSGEHLDYHKTMENYAAAKARLFEMLDPAGVGVINGDDAWSTRVARDCRAKVVKFGFTPAADYAASDLAISAQGSCFTLNTPHGQATVSSPLVGRHNVANLLTAMALVGETFGLTPAVMASALADCHGAPGRLQPVLCGQDFAVLVDYAHTDEALRNVLTALRPLTRGKLRVLFGCGGDRDRTKRPRMARACQDLADVVYLTSDNPRTEQPLAIIDEVVTGFSPDWRGAGHGDGQRLYVEADRHQAIRQIIAHAAAGDVVLLAGKGHENYQILGSIKHHFDDVEEATVALAARAKS